MTDKEAVRWAYRLILGREPETEDVLKQDFRDLEELRLRYLNSPEFGEISSNGFKQQKPASIKLIRDFNDYDKFIKKYLERDMDGMDDASFFNGYQLDFQSFAKAFGRPMQSRDPFSDEYSNWELSFFEFLSGQKYDVNREGIDPSTDPLEKSLAFFWNTNMSVSKLRLYADFFSKARIAPHDHVLEMGCGYGYLTELIGRYGCIITSIDAQKKFAEITANMCTLRGFNANVLCLSFCDVENIDGVFDVVVFEQSFHHCGEPFRMLDILYRKTSINCRLYFLCEAISDSYDRPWGINKYNGDAIMQIRLRGWLELTFRPDFFAAALLKSGFKLHKTYQMCDGTILYEAVKDPIYL